MPSPIQPARSDARRARAPGRPQSERIAPLRTDARRSEDVLLTRFDAAALVPVLQGRQYLLVHVERASDILQVLALKREFPSLKIVLVGASEGWTVADRIAQVRHPGHRVGGQRSARRRSSRSPRPSRTSAGCARAGVKVSIGMIDDNDTRNLFMGAPICRQSRRRLQRVPGATGVSWGEALAMITSRPAEAIGMGGEIGSLAPGRRADVVIWSGDPLEGIERAPSRCSSTAFASRSRPTRRDCCERYRYLPRRDLPEAYRH